MPKAKNKGLEIWKNKYCIQVGQRTKGKVTYARAGGSKKILINKKTGKVTIKKKLRKGTYKLKVKVKAAGTSKYKDATKKVTVNIKVK